MPARKPRSLPWIGIVVLAVLIGVYVGAYYATVVPLTGTFVPVDLPDGTQAIGRIRITSYRWPDAAIASFFDPIHWLDRKMRPSVWKTEIDWELTP